MKIKKASIAAMETKRKASSDLNHENWDREEEPEEKGSFQVASEDVLKNRVIKKAARRSVTASDSGETKSVFSGFSGFSKTASTVSAGSPFSFLSKVSTTPGAVTPASTGPSTTTPPTKTAADKTDNKFAFEKSSTYYAKLKSLNQAVTDWIKTHVDKNPLCILSPIFKDYEKYLKEIQNEQPDNKITSTASSTSFKFGTSAASTSAKANDDSDKPAEKFSFGTVNSTTDNKSLSSSSIFGKASSTDKPAENKFGSFSFKPAQSAVEPSSSKVSSIFSSPSSTSGEASASSGFSFGSGKPFTFSSSVTAPAASTEKEEDDDEPPKVEFTPVVEEDSVYNKRCKVFVKHDGNYADRGIGTLYLKSVKDQDKTQLIVRADTNLGNILLNFILNESIPAQRLGKNNVMMVCIPTPDADPKPTSILLRVKTGEEADELLSTINKYKK